MTHKTKAQIEAVDTMIDAFLALDTWEGDAVEHFAQLTLSKAQLVTALAEQWSIGYREGVKESWAQGGSDD